MQIILIINLCSFQLRLWFWCFVLALIRILDFISQNKRICHTQMNSLQYKMTPVCIYLHCRIHSVSVLGQWTGAERGQRCGHRGVGTAEQGEQSTSCPNSASERERRGRGGERHKTGETERNRENEKTRIWGGKKKKSKSENRWMCEQSYFVRIVCLSRVETSRFDIMLHICFPFTSF